MNRFLLTLLFGALGFSSAVLAQTPACCNILTNGDFELGYTEFTSGLPQNCGCASNSHCVGTNFQVKCAGWDNVPDHTSGSGNFLIIDGSTGGGVDVWRKSTPIQANVNYCFSFWVASQYDQPFDLELTVDGVTVPGSTFSVQQGSPVWTQYSLNFTGISGSVLAIRQVTGGGFRDFGIDDIEFGAPLMAAFAHSPDVNCGMNVSFFNQSTGQSPLTYAWNFDDPNSGNANVSTLQNPTHQFTTCGTYNVCLEVSKGGCTDLICQSILVEDLEPPTALCSGISLELDANCLAIITPGLIDAGSFDNCDIAFMSVSPNLITGCGFFPVTLTVTDLCENTSDCTVEVQTSESVPPILDCPPNLSVQGTLNPQGICTGIMPQLNVGALDNCGTVQISSVPAQGAVISAGSTVVAVTGEDECGNTDTCSVTITVYCETGACACPAGGSSGPNLVTNGTFTAGDVGFGSLPLDCSCIVNSHCVLPQFTDKCSGWTANFYDHTYGNNPLSQFLVIDGHPNAAADVWTQPITVAAGKTYCFSFWVARVYPTTFNLGVTLNGVLVDPSAIFSVNSGAWTQHSITWTNASLNGTFTLAIRQMTGGGERDFGLDDICLREVCEADFTFQNLDNCGKVQFTSTSANPSSLQYCWDFDGDPTTCESTLPNPMWQFPTCGTYNVCLTISNNNCVTTICQTVVIVDNTPPIASCVGGLSIILNANCTASLSANDVNLGSSDECPFQLSISQSTFTQCGVYPVELTVTDWCGNTSTCSAPINVVEMVAPVINYCPNNIAVVGTIGSNGLCSGYVVPFPTPFASDNCDPLVQLTNNAPPSGFFPAGTTNVLWTATDDCGNTATCSYTVHVGCEFCACDGAQSQNLVANGDFTLGNVGFSSGLAWDNGAGCAAGRYGIYTNIGAFCSGWGPLTAASPPNFLALDGSIAAGPTVLWQTPVTLTSNTEYCFSLKWSVGFQHPFQTFPISIDIVDLSGIPIPGVTAVGNFVVTGAPGWVNYSINWNSGPLSSGQYYIAIRQLTGDDYRDWAVDDICFTKAAAPCETSINVTQNSDCAVTVTAVTTGAQPVVYQWCDGHTGPSYTTQVLPCVPMTYCVTATCSDGSTSTASVVYTATDVTPPVAVCNLGIGLDLGSACTFLVTPAFVDGGSTDNCGIQSMSVSPTLLQACTTTTVTLTVTDYCGNTSTCSMGIQTAESEPPTITCPPNVSANALPSSCSILVNGIGFLSANDNCGFPAISCTINNNPVVPANASGTTFNQGTSVVVYTATDACNNTGTCSFTVTVSCNEEHCACPSGEAPGPNLIVNGDFSSGPAGFTSGLTGPSTGCLTGTYGVIQNFSAYCSGWQNLGAASSPNFLVLDGSANPGPTVLWKSQQINLTQNTNYCFSFKWALAFAHPLQDFPIEVVVLDLNGNVVSSLTPTIQVNSTAWTSSSLNFNSLALTGTHYMAIRQLTGSIYRDFGIDDICMRTKDCVDAPSNLVSWWSMDDAIGDPLALDLVGINHATPSGGSITNTISGVVDGAIQFFSPGFSHLSVAANPSQDFGSGSFAIDAWVITDMGTQTEPIVEKLSNNTGYSLSIQGTPSAAFPTLILGTGSTVQLIQGPPIQVGIWNFVAVSIDGQSNTVTFCVGNAIDGFVSSGPISIAPYIASSPSPFLIAYNSVNPHWAIAIDELELFQGTLSCSEFEEIFNAGSFGKCKPGDVCACGTFSELFTHHGGQPVSVNCGDLLFLSCPDPGNSLPFRGKFGCFGNGCPANATVTWTWSGPSGTYSGTMQAGPSFYLSIPPAYFIQSGIYNLTLSGSCGGQPCPPCEFTIHLNCPEICPCTPEDKQALQTAVNTGFAVTKWPFNCKACFSPLALSDCETVEWHLNNANGPLIGTSLGNQTFCHNFGNPGSYTVAMVVSRQQSDGSICATFPYTTTITLNCLGLITCSGSISANSDFEISPVSGGLGSGTGESPGWKSVHGDPHVDIKDGKWGIQLTGNRDTADVLTTTTSNCVEKNTGTLMLRASINPSSSNIKRCEIFFNRNDSYVFNVFNPENCFHVASIDLTPFDTSWFDLEIPYDLSAWSALDTCGDAPHGVLIRPIIYVTNDQGGEEARAEMFLDAFCMDDQVVPVINPAGPTAFRIFPNPNTGTFMVELPEAASAGMSFRIIGLTGQVLHEQPTKIGLTTQTVEPRNLPTGLYFLQVVTDNKVIAIEKFVKQ